ncbi:aspartyl/asparaginyl beta-hydroxylase domain-containing protein [Novosphingobium sp.]|uniref:aspartyl/asparaginyl beta-hydroxylase domain-containing protein n=1 Tax=Novosphingobium sp. TaxID=1874826 RepID=UPI00286A02CD|nr:aspartyl/asparaginyl beta-hydroxylase domain-containing protein [Novosphingobium sp.]
MDATTREWNFGDLMVFDDSVEHEAWNNSDHGRLVLIFDIWRPELSEEERGQIEALFGVVDTY